MEFHEEIQAMIELLNFIEAQCLNLKRLSIAPYNEGTSRDPTTNSRLLDINIDLLKLDLRDINGSQVPDRELSWLYVSLENLLKQRNFFARKTQIHHDEIEKYGNKDSISYWKGVEVVNCLHCQLTVDRGYPSLWIAVLHIFVRCNNDGSLATLPENTPENIVDLRNKLSFIEPGNVMPDELPEFSL